MSLDTRVLILGGTGEGAVLARALARNGRAVPILSLAGLTDAPPIDGIIMRTGGFGGVQGLATYIRATGIAAVIDATHPFAKRISENAAESCSTAGVPLFRVQRRPWLPETSDDWHAVDTIEAGLSFLRDRRFARVFATLGRRALPLLAAEPAIRFLVRGIVLPDEPPANVTWIAGRPPFPLAAEIALLQRHEIEALFVQASGGDQTAAKLAAARALRLPVVMLTRPQPPAGGDAAGSVAEALAWLERVMVPDANRARS